ncbi:MAG: anti-sigma factor [Pseudomonadota bacterium]
MSRQTDTPSHDAPQPTVPLPVSEVMLQAYVDGRLGESERQQVEDFLASHPEHAAKVDGYHRIDHELHALFDPVLDEAVPERFSRLLAGAGQADARPSRRGQGLSRLRELATRLFRPAGGGMLAPALPMGGWRLSSYAASVLWLGIGLAAGLHLQQPAVPLDGPPPMVKHAAVAYVTYASEVAHPVEVGAGEEAHLVAWLSKRLGIDLKAAKLDTVGYTLMGGRLLAGTQRPVAQFMYEDRIGRRLTLYIKTQESGHDQSAAFRFAQEDDVNAFYWIENGTGFVLSGNVDRNDLFKVAKVVYAQLNAPEQERPGAARPLPAPARGKAT